VVSWEIDFDPATWLAIPEIRDEAELEEWVDRASQAVVKDFSAELKLVPEYPEVVRYQLRVLGEMAQRRAADGSLILAHLPGPDWDPMPVEVAFVEPRSESPDYLLDMAGARGLPAVQPPTVEHVLTDDLGEGIRVLRYEDDKDLGLVANLCYAWRAHETDVFLFVQTDDLGRLEETADDIAGLIQTIHPARERSGDV
jgi:hypothetical protein